MVFERWKKRSLRTFLGSPTLLTDTLREYWDTRYNFFNKMDEIGLAAFLTACGTAGIFEVLTYGSRELRFPDSSIVKDDWAQAYGIS